MAKLRSLLTRAQLGLMRAIGLRKLREALDIKVDATQAHVLTMIERLQTALTERDRAIGDRFGLLEERLAALSDQLSRQGGAATERGDTDQNTFRALQAKLDGLLGRDSGSAQALGELRAEMSGLRADLAREFEMLMDQNRGGDHLQQAVGEVRAEMSGLRADLARNLETLVDKVGRGDGSRQAVDEIRTEMADLPPDDAFRPKPSASGAGRNPSTAS